MCLMCEQEDLYFLYLEQREQAQKRARGETAAPNPGWLWPSFVTAAPSAAEPAETSRPPSRQSDFTCDAAE